VPQTARAIAVGGAGTYEWWDNISLMLGIPRLVLLRFRSRRRRKHGRHGEPWPCVTLASLPGVSWASCPRWFTGHAEGVAPRTHIPQGEVGEGIRFCHPHAPEPIAPDPPRGQQARVPARLPVGLGQDSQGRSCRSCTNLANLQRTLRSAGVIGLLFITTTAPAFAYGMFATYQLQPPCEPFLPMRICSPVTPLSQQPHKKPLGHG